MRQSEALDILKMGKNVLLTGPAGSGKTHVVNSYVEYLKNHAVDVAVTASTGIAATHIGGMTIHSWAGIGVRENLSDYEVEDLMEKQYLYKRFERTKVLIIDEISMLHSVRLDLIDFVCRKMKRSDESFGGMQVVLCGDFFQLPPVTRGETMMNLDGNILSDFVYNSESFRNGDFSICYIEEQHRQKDGVYLGLLNEIRSGKVSSRTLELLKSRLNSELSDGGNTTRLYTHNIDVDVVNKKHLDLLNTNSKTYYMKSSGSAGLSEVLKKSCLSPEELELKIGAKVMFTKNHPDGTYVNGTLGEVVEFNSFGEPVVLLNNGVRFSVTSASWKIEEDGKVKAEIIQLPLRLAWAITVHKSQGMSLDSMEVDLTKSFVKGMGYVALSRVRSLSGMKLLGFNQMSLLVNEEVLEMDKKFQEKSKKAEQKLNSMDKSDILEAQKKWLKQIEPEEKIKIKKKEKELKKSTHEITRELVESETPLKEIAVKRGVKEETIISHIEDMQMEGIDLDVDYLKRELKRGELDDILDVFNKLNTKSLAPVYNYLLRNKKKPTYLKIRLARLFL